MTASNKRLRYDFWQPLRRTRRDAAGQQPSYGFNTECERREGPALITFWAKHGPTCYEVCQRARFCFVVPGRTVQTLNCSNDAQFNLRAPEAQRV